MGRRTQGSAGRDQHSQFVGRGVLRLSWEEELGLVWSNRSLEGGRDADPSVHIISTKAQRPVGLSCSGDKQLYS